MLAPGVIVMATAVAAVGAVGALGYGLYRLVFAQQFRLNRALRAEGADVSLMGSAGLAVHQRRTDTRRAQRDGALWEDGVLETYTVQQRNRGGPLTEILSQQAYVERLGAGARPYRLANLTPGTPLHQLARTLLVPVQEIFDDRIMALVPDAPDFEAARARSADELEVLSRVLTLPEDALRGWLADQRPGGRAVRAIALLQAFGGEPVAQAVAIREQAAADPSLRAWAALTLGEPAVLMAAACDPALGARLRVRALRARAEQGWTADGVEALVAAAADAPSDVVAATAEALAGEPALAEAALLRAVAGRLAPGWVELVARLGGPSALPVLGAYAHGDDADEATRGLALAALERVKARLPEGQRGRLAVARAEAGGLSAAEAQPGALTSAD